MKLDWRALAKSVALSAGCVTGAMLCVYLSTWLLQWMAEEEWNFRLGVIGFLLLIAIIFSIANYQIYSRRGR